jgi:ABC-2 type transport system permease protein
MPVFILPQFLLCGLLTARSSMAPPLEWISYALPMSYSYEALSLVAAGDTGDSRLLRDVAFILAFGLAALAAGSATLPRRTE